LVLMSIEPGEEIGEETHDVDQILVFVGGEGEALLDGKKAASSAGHFAPHQGRGARSRAPLAAETEYPGRGLVGG
jgi:hypothetical protein